MRVTEIRVIVVVAAMCGVSNSQCYGRVRAVVPISPSFYNTYNPVVPSIADDLTSILLLGNTLGYNQYCPSCGSRGSCGCANPISDIIHPNCRPSCNPGCDCYDCAAVVNTLVDALVKTVLLNHGNGPHGSRGSNPTNPSQTGGGGKKNLIDLGLLQGGQNGGLDVLNLALGDQGVLGVNLGGAADGGGPPKGPKGSGPKGPTGPPAPSGPKSPSTDDLIELGLLQTDPDTGNLVVADLNIAGKGILGVDLGGVAQ